MNRLVVEGQLVDPVRGSCWGQVEIVDGTIARVGDLGLRPDLRAADHQLVFPGFVDVHVHLRHGDEHKEDFQSATRAALQGGVTSMLDMPNNPVPPLRVEDLRIKQDLVKDLPIDIGFYLALSGATDPDDHPFYKAYMGPSTRSLGFSSAEALEQAVQHHPGRCLTFHCEDPAMLAERAGQGPHEDQRPVEAEWKAVRLALDLGHTHRVGVHVAHMTSGRSLEMVEEARSRGQQAITEAGPHHLYFDRENRHRFARDSWLKMNPPLRSPEERHGLLKAFLAGRVDFLATDHAPHTREEKATVNPSGVPLLDTYGAFVCWLMAQGFTPEQVARHCSYNPGKFMGGLRGRLESGYRGHLAILDPEAAWTVQPEDLHTRCGWSPFEGHTLPGRVACTVASGRVFRAGLEVT